MESLTEEITGIIRESAEKLASESAAGILEALAKRAKADHAMSALREDLASLEHEQWRKWSKEVSLEVGPETQARWGRSWIPYNELPEDVKERDRRWADKVLALLRIHLGRDVGP